MHPSGRIPVACLALLLMVPVAASASGLYVPSVGARASAMGGAFIGLADDYSAVSWNPAGIVSIQGVEGTVSIQDAILLGSRDGNVRFEDPGNPAVADYYALQSVAATSSAEHSIAPGFFIYSDAGPLRGLFSKIGLCGYTIAGYGAEWDASDVADEFVSHLDNNYGVINRNGEAPRYSSNVRAYVISPVVAREFSERFSIGVAGHALYGSFSLETGSWIPEGSFDPGAPSGQQYILDLYPYQMSEELTGWGYGATVGAQYWLTDLLSLGAVVRTPINVTLEGDVEVTSPLAEYRSESQTETFDFTFPMWVGAGMAYDDFLFEGTVLTADAQWTKWSEVYVIEREVENELPDDLGMTKLSWENTLEFGVGIDYRLSRSTSMMLGYRYVPSPVPNETFDFVMPMSQKSVFSFGVGYHSDVWTLDVGFSYQAGEPRNIGESYEMAGKHLDDVMIPSLSFTYGF